jgi:hypothetical protein
MPLSSPAGDGKRKGVKRTNLEIWDFFHPNPSIRHQRGGKMLGEKAAE